MKNHIADGIVHLHFFSLLGGFFIIFTAFYIKEYFQQEVNYKYMFHLTIRSTN